MDECIDTTEIMTDVESLISFVSYGKQKLESFTSQIKELEKEIPVVCNKNQYLFYFQSYTRLRNLIQMTDETLLDWKVKTSSYLFLLRKMHLKKFKDPVNTSELRNIESKAVNLLSMINDQCESIKKIFVRIASIKNILETKKIQLQPKIERGQAPSFERHKQMYLDRMVAELV